MLLVTKSKRHLKEESILDLITKQIVGEINYSKIWSHMNMWIWVVNVCVVTSAQKSVTVVCVI